MTAQLGKQFSSQYMLLIIWWLRVAAAVVEQGQQTPEAAAAEQEAILPRHTHQFYRALLTQSQLGLAALAETHQTTIKHLFLGQILL
jgi:hypothetical protein